MLDAIQTLEGHTDRVWALAWNPSGTILASSGSDKTIRLWAKGKSEQWMCISILTDTHNKSIRRLCWSPCGNYLASASFDSTVCIWKRQPIDGSWSTIVNLEGHESEVKSVAWSSDGNYLASCGRDRTIWIWERATGDNDDRDFEGTDSAENWDCSDVKNDHTKDVKHIVWHPNYPILVSCSYDDTVKLFHKDGDDWTCFETLNVHTSTVWSADFSASGKYLVTCSDDKTVRIWKNHSHDKLPQVETNSWKCVSVIQGYHNRSIYDVSWSKLDDVIVSASGDNSLAVYRPDSKESQDGCDLYTCAERLSKAHECDVNCVVWNPVVPGLLASGSDDRKIKLWNYSPNDTGMKPLTVIDELIQSLSASKIQTNTDSLSTSQTDKTTAEFDLNLGVDNFGKLLDCVKIMQQLKTEIYEDNEMQMLQKMLDIKFSCRSPQSIDISSLTFDEQEGRTRELTISISNNAGVPVYNFRIIISESPFTLKLPRRSIKLSVVNDQMFLSEKTGDLFQILPSGECRFLLGHLFILSDVQFITNNDSSQILYIISADRDEKIRISNYPDTFDIERFCFGHQNYLKRLMVVDETKFVSIDEQNEVCLWNLEDLRTSSESSKPLRPHLTLSMDENTRKRICLR